MGADDEAKKVMYLLWRWRDMLRCVPRHEFSEEDHGPAPDYSSLEFWSAHPRRAAGARPVEDANWLVAPGRDLKETEARPCDCFYLHDSTMAHAETLPFLGSCAPRWNAPLGPQLPEGSLQSMMASKIDEQTDMRVAASASSFSSLCRVYAPRYRQMNVFGFFVMRGPLHRLRADARTALSVAYSDVRRAFETVVDDPANADRPFIIAGHSQGAQHLVRLLQEEVEPRPDRLRRFVHAYHAGHVIPMDLFGRTLRAVRPSGAADDIRSVSSWRTARRGHALRFHLLCRRMGTVFYADRGAYRHSHAPQLATNPVTWSSLRGGEASEPEQHLGAVWPLVEGMDPRDHAGVASSGINLRFGHLVARGRAPLGGAVRQLQPVPVEKAPGDGFRVRVDRFGLARVPALPRGSLGALAERDFLLYHDLDLALYHGNIRDNAALRYRAWLRQSEERRHDDAPPLLSRL